MRISCTFLYRPISSLSSSPYKCFPFIRTSVSLPFSIGLVVGFTSTFEQVCEDKGPLVLTLQATQAVDQPFTVLLDSRLLPAGNNSATGELVSRGQPLATAFDCATFHGYCAIIVEGVERGWPRETTSECMWLTLRMDGGTITMYIMIWVWGCSYRLHSFIYEWQPTRLYFQVFQVWATPTPCNGNVSVRLNLASWFIYLIEATPTHHICKFT